MSHNPHEIAENPPTRDAAAGSGPSTPATHGVSRRKLLAAALAATVCLTGAAYVTGGVAGGYVAGRLAQADAAGYGAPSEERGASGLQGLTKAGYSVAIAQHDLSAYLDGTLGFASGHVPGNTSCGCPACCGEVPQVIEQAPPNPGPSEASTGALSSSVEEV